MLNGPIANRQTGFTLIELIVVVVIIGVMAGFATLSIGLGHSDEVKQEARRLQALMEIAAQESLLSGRDLGMLFTENSYQFYSWELVDEKFNCVPIVDDEHLSEPRELSEQMELELYVEGSIVDFAKKPDIGCHLLLLSSGELTEFELLIQQYDSDLSYQLVGSITGQLALRQQGNEEHD